jgi:ribosomal protein S18 acetylase RimI-like enzyme
MELLQGAVGFTQLYPVFSSVSCTRKYLLNDLFVVPAARRSGAGRALLVAAADFARAQGAASLSLSTGVDNATAQRLYESLGWTRDESYYEYNLTL